MKLHTDKEYEGSMAVIPRFSSPSSSLFSLDILAKTPPSFPSELSSSSQKNSPSGSSRIPLFSLPLSQYPACSSPSLSLASFSQPSPKAPPPKISPQRPEEGSMQLAKRSAAFADSLDTCHLLIGFLLPLT